MGQDLSTDRNMGELLAFQHRKPASTERREPHGPAEIIFFLGVRYERMEEPPLQPVKQPRRTARRRDKTKKEKAS